ncbi:MAG: hypothetical protein IEMM0008_0206 [bacterium]|nr:MAG: hypothetical protein IEMM0008_0206 [bacterium]
MAGSQGDIIPDSDIITNLSEDISFKGTLKFKKSLKIKGQFEGEILSPEGYLVVGNQAQVKASIIARQVSNLGSIIGDVKCHDRLEIYGEAKLDGNVVTEEIVIKSGGIFNGYCTMKPDLKEDKMITG